jgi:hypothetical protein
VSQSQEIIPSKVTVLKLVNQPSPGTLFPGDFLALTLLVMNAVAAIVTLVIETVKAFSLSDPHLNTLLSSLL